MGVVFGFDWGCMGVLLGLMGCFGEKWFSVCVCVYVCVCGCVCVVWCVLCVSEKEGKIWLFYI